MNPQDAQKDNRDESCHLYRGGAEAPAAKERVINIMAAQMKISHDDAAKRFDDSQAKLKQTATKPSRLRKNRLMPVLPQRLRRRSRALVCCYSG